MANPMYGQNKADDRIDNSMYLLVGPTVSIAASAVANGDLIGQVRIPAGTFVHKVELETVVVAAGGTAANTELDVGDIGDPNLYLDDVDGAADTSGLGTAGQIVRAPLGIAGNGKYYAAEDTIAINVVAESSTSGTCRLLVHCSTPIIP